jgi:hypothetical protein
MMIIVYKNKAHRKKSECWKIIFDTGYKLGKSGKIAPRKRNLKLTAVSDVGGP